MKERWGGGEMEGMEKISRSGEMEMEYSRKMKGMTERGVEKIR